MQWVRPDLPYALRSQRALPGAIRLAGWLEARLQLRDRGGEAQLDQEPLPRAEAVL